MQLQRGAETFNHPVKAALAMDLLSPWIFHTKRSLWYTENVIQKEKCSLFPATPNTPSFLGAVFLHPQGSGLPSSPEEEFSPDCGVLIETMLDWKM